MSITTENILLIGSILLFISIIAGKTSYRFGIPTLVLFLGIGILAGSEGIGGIYFYEPKIAQLIGIVALNFILFSGGLDTNFQHVKPVLWHGFSLSTLGVVITAFSVGFFVYYITDFTLYEGLLLGAIVSSTDAAAVFSILRSKKVALKKDLRPTLELESGSNDPMAYFLTIAFTGLVLNQDKSILSILPLLLQQFIIGGLLGFLIGKLGRFIINNIRLVYEGLYPVLVIAIMFFSFSGTDFIGGNGFLSVYITALYLGNKELIHKKTIIQTFDGFAWLMQIILFLTLGLLVYPSQIIPLIGIGLIISLFLILIARPLSVFLSLAFFKTKIRNKLFVSWIGLRGAVPIVFATYPLLAGIEKSQIIFNIVFFISLSSVILQGTTLAKISRLLHVSLPLKVRPKSPVEVLLDDDEKTEYEEFKICKNSPVIGKKIVDLDIPQKAIIAMIKKADKYVTPKGSTVIEEGDVLLVISEDYKSMKETKDIFLST